MKLLGHYLIDNGITFFNVWLEEKKILDINNPQNYLEFKQDIESIYQKKTDYWEKIKRNIYELTTRNSVRHKKPENLFKIVIDKKHIDIVDVLINRDDKNKKNKIEEICCVCGANDGEFILDRTLLPYFNGRTSNVNNLPYFTKYYKTCPKCLFFLMTSVFNTIKIIFNKQEYGYIYFHSNNYNLLLKITEYIYKYNSWQIKSLLYNYLHSFLTNILLSVDRTILLKNPFLRAYIITNDNKENNNKLTVIDYSANIIKIMLEKDKTSNCFDYKFLF